MRDEEFAAVGAYLYRNGNRFSGVAACQSCHGAEGQGTRQLPRLAGQHKRYLLDQLQSFNQRTRSNDNAIMHTIASKLTEFEMEALALYISGTVNLRSGKIPITWHRVTRHFQNQECRYLVK
ncbi:MAG: c-type cytochrome, partial [Candidatus Sedimenticola endophacoides]